MFHFSGNFFSQVVAIITLLPEKVIIVSRDQTVSHVDINTYEKLKVLPLFEPIESAVLTDEGHFYTVGEEGVLKCWNIEKSKLLRQKKLSRSAF